ncbi:unnamed protein product [Phytophthora fragariaefolia]|uniref:Unnamed protein product n=1 Tax=Phytophthora fragariaefolia TaxID=1490495 RepID=A0A9W6XWF2_9STRA|nr:unnamed protein product [Phytophthora fragariaefolia]
MVLPFLGSDVMSWYREFKLAMCENPRPWPLFKQQIRARYRASDYEFKLLTKMHDLRITRTQQEYNTKFMQLLSQSSIDMPEVLRSQGAQVAQVWRHARCSKKLGRSVGWRPTKDNASAVHHAAELRQACGSHDHIDYYTDDVDFMRHNSTENGHLQQSGSIHGQPATAFVDSGASFNAVSPLFAYVPGTSRNFYVPLTTNFVFFINPGEGPMTEKCAAAWAALKDTKVYPLLSEFRNSVFRSELPSIPPSRQNNMDATINVADSIPVHRKQFPFSKEQRDAIIKWTQEMLKAKLIQASSSPYCAPTFCVLIRKNTRNAYFALEKYRVWVTLLVKMDPAKAAAINDWPLPKTKRELQSCIGTCVYVSRFCPGFADYVAVLTELVKNKRPKDSISFSEHQKSAFQALKHQLTSTSTLAHADFSEDFHVSVDASDFAIGGYLFQLDDYGREQIIAYGGRKLNRAELIYPTQEKELLAALNAMRVLTPIIGRSKDYSSNKRAPRG